jgi:hypothetical protein
MIGTLSITHISITAHTHHHILARSSTLRYEMHERREKGNETDSGYCLALTFWAAFVGRRCSGFLASELMRGEGDR